MPSFEWASTASPPNAVIGRLGFSAFMGDVCYALDNGNAAGAGVHFYSYDRSNNSWTTLTAPGGGYVYFSSWAAVVRIGSTKVAILANKTDAVYKGTGFRRLAIYDIAGDSWTYSSVQPWNVGPYTGGSIETIAVQDADTLWCFIQSDHYTSGGTDNSHMKCLRYVISTDTWTSFAATIDGPVLAAGGSPRPSGYDDAGYVYGGIQGSRNLISYNITGDSYGLTTQLLSGYQYVLGSAPVGYIPCIKATGDWLGYTDITAAPALSNTSINIPAPTGADLTISYTLMCYDEARTRAMAWLYYPAGQTPQIYRVTSASSGFWAAATPGTVDNMNASLLQVGTAAGRPAAAQSGREYRASNTEVWSRDNGGSWDTTIDVDAAASTPSLRSLGPLATQAAPGPHTH